MTLCLLDPPIAVACFEDRSTTVAALAAHRCPDVGVELRRSRTSASASRSSSGRARIQSAHMSSQIAPVRGRPSSASSAMFARVLSMCRSRPSTRRRTRTAGPPPIPSRSVRKAIQRRWWSLCDRVRFHWNPPLGDGAGGLAADSTLRRSSKPPGCNGFTTRMEPYHWPSDKSS
jgi:hypothetical protein